jgi:hypothetical protein
MGFPEPEPEPEPPDPTLEEEDPDDMSVGRGRIGLFARPLVVHAARGGMYSLFHL